MTLALDNLYNGDGTISDILARIAHGNNIDREALCVLLQTDLVPPKIKEETLYKLATRNSIYRRIWVDFIKRDIVPHHDMTLLANYKTYIIGKVNIAYLLTDSEITELYFDINFLMANGFVEFYPYIRYLFNRHGKTTSASSAEFRALSYYSVVFGYDGYNCGCIKEQLKRSPSYKEGEFEIFTKLKSPVERAYSEYGRALLSVMNDAFKKRKFNHNKLEKHLMAIPRDYKDRLHVATLLRHSERLYKSFRRFFKAGGAYGNYNIPFNDYNQDKE